MPDAPGIHIDPVLEEIAAHAVNYPVNDGEIMRDARYCLMDALGGGLRALTSPACLRLLGPGAPGATLAGGVPIPGTGHRLEPIQAAFNLGSLLAWEDCRAQWPSARPVYPADTLGGILACGDYFSRRAVREGKSPLLLREALQAFSCAAEIHGALSEVLPGDRESGLALRLAGSATITALLGGSYEDILSALTHAWLDGARPVRPSFSPRRWSAGDAAARATWLSLLALRGEPPVGIEQEETLFPSKGLPALAAPLDSRVIREMLFCHYPGVPLFAHSALEAARHLHREVKPRLEEIDRVVLESAFHAVQSREENLGRLTRLAGFRQCQRDLSYVVAVALLSGKVMPSDFSEDRWEDPRMDFLRARMQIVAPREAMPGGEFSHALQVFFRDGNASQRVRVEWPEGHPRRRVEGMHLLIAKFARQLGEHLPPRQCDRLLDLCAEQEKFENTPIHEFMELVAL